MIRVHLSDTKSIDVSDADGPAMYRGLESADQTLTVVEVVKRNSGGKKARINPRHVLFTEELADA